MTDRLSARELMDLVFDDGSWISWDEPSSGPTTASGEYAEELAAAVEKSGEDE